MEALNTLIIRVYHYFMQGEHQGGRCLRKGGRHNMQNRRRGRHSTHVEKKEEEEGELKYARKKKSIRFLVINIS